MVGWSCRVAKTKDDMIRFRCHRCKKRIAAPQGNVGKKVKCPGCQIVTIVPDIPSAELAAKPQSQLRGEPTLQAPPLPMPEPEPAPMDDLSQLATATDDAYEMYEPSGSHYLDPDRPRGPRVKRSHLQWLGALSMGLHILWVLTLALSIFYFVVFIIGWNRANEMNVEVPIGSIILAFGMFFTSLVFCFCCLTGAMACGMVRAMGAKMNTL